ncbi:carboxypeptidase-like regulatory domain-containing protein [Nocardioides lianchengensis]|uniref:Carboxypeptidase regulatory-like domain-containing protein n=1 Tax=Nocardioides lianchengensis TaxID=1045774 RepID=A0A1G6XRC7_9ACTN|nr:carboxypeptidase-like regulatory domain-containing protein [Nocardioides lianchengensis]NYG13380.1 hypothetical protein [Nocardioides lianchengensis]SDD79876.1 Carboxypeptidase regulatory-like domain-containing protein [Nocardioides lianchengensis]
MRVATEHRVVPAEPGSTIELVVDVVNTSDLIDGVTANLIGLPAAQVEVEPKVLPLFPSAQGQITLAVEVPSTQPAGSHPITVEVVSHGAGAVTQHVDIDLSVSARPAVRLGRTPHTVRGRRSGRFVLDVENTGNTALDVELEAQLEDSRTAARFTPRTLRVDPGVTTPVILVLKGPRMFTGAEVDRTAAINLSAKRTNVISAMQEAETEAALQAATTVVLRQRPTVSRGVLTALVLMTIIGLWAAVFLLGVTQVLSGDPLTKTAPASFFPVSAETAAEGGAGTDAAGGTAGGAEAAGGAAAAGGGTASAEPAGAMPKDGTLPAGVGGTIEGTVFATSNKLPVGRILVEAFRDGRQGRQLVSSAATQADGTYSLAGLFPTSYTLRFSAKGYDPIWYKSATGAGKADRVSVKPQSTSDGINATVTGDPATISGRLDPGNSLVPPTATVTARPLDILTPDGQPAGVVARTTTDASGSYTLRDLPAPASYEVSIVAEGYFAKKVLTAVSGGEQRLQPSVVPSASAGAISGTVTDGKDPLGGVVVSTTVNGEAISVITPTVGAVGSFTLGDLPTPGTYLLTFSAEGHGSTTEIVGLAAGATDNTVKITLVEGTGSVQGTISDLDGLGIGGATVTVGGAGAAAADGTTPPTGTTIPTTTTLTEGESRGSFTISGLQAPGEYTLTITKEGYSPQSVPVVLGASGPASSVDITLTDQLGRLVGRVVGPDGKAYVGATVTATNGLNSWTATSGAEGNGGLGDGGYRMDGLPPGTYSVTVRADAMLQQTALVRILPGVRSEQGLRLGEVG